MSAAHVGNRGITEEAVASTTMTVTVTGATEVGNTLFVMAGGRGGTATLNTVTDTRGNAWAVNQTVLNGSSNLGNAVASCPISVAHQIGDTVTLTFSSTFGNSRLAMLEEFSGIVLVDPEDMSASAVGSSISPATGATLETSQADELAIALFLQGTGNPTWTVPAGYTEFNSGLTTLGAVNGDRALYVAFKVLSAAGVQSATAGSSVNAGWNAGIVTFKAAETEPPDPPADPEPVSISPRDMWTAAADSSGNQRLDTAGKRSVIRLVARATATLENFYVKVRSNALDGASYAAGTGGAVEAKLCPVNPDGTPDVAGALATVSFAVNGADPANPGTSTNGIRLNFAAAVVEGTAYAVVFRNSDALPAVNYWSVNFIYDGDGTSGAQSRNELSESAEDVYYGLDPREVVGASDDGGATWAIPGSPENLTFDKHVPVYVQKYSDGSTYSQPWYSATTSYTAGEFNMVFQNHETAYAINGIGVYESQVQAGDFDVEILVDGVVVATATVSDPTLGHSEHMLGTAVAVAVGAAVSLRFTADPAGTTGLRLRQHYADSYFQTQAGLGTSHPVYLEESQFRVFPVWPTITESGSRGGSGQAVMTAKFYWGERNEDGSYTYRRRRR